MSDMKDEAERASQEEQLSLPQVLSEKSIRWQLISICLMMLCQQLSGELNDNHMRLKNVETSASITCTLII